jgi:hypothetical protein
LAFTALITDDAMQQPVLTDIRQGGFFLREGAHHPYLHPPARHE